MIYVFGDSMTKYFWPTWPTWYEKYSGEKIINLAYPGYGTGNLYWNLIDQLPNIKEGDKVFMMWTQCHRSVEWYDRDWLDKRDVLGFFPSSNGKLWYGDDFLGLYRTHPDHEHSFTDGIVKSFSLILSCQQLLESKNIDYQMMFAFNPWLDNRYTWKPKFKINIHKWFENEKIKKSEIEHANKILKISPVKNLINLINWNTFFEPPEDPFDPSTYRNGWDLHTTNIKEYVVAQHPVDPHPSPLINHDLAVKMLGGKQNHHRKLAIELAQEAATMLETQEWKENDYTATPETPLMDKRFNKYF